MMVTFRGVHCHSFCNRLGIGTNWAVIGSVSDRPPCRHPDKNKSPEAQEKIMQLNQAYEVIILILKIVV